MGAVFKLIRRLLLAAWVAALGTAVVAKLMLESHGDTDTEEVDLIAIFEGRELLSNADPFYGGKILAMYGGVMLDLRKATPAPTGVYLDVSVVFGGLEVVLPEGWRAEFKGKTIMGGFADETRTGVDDDVPFVTIDGNVLMGGVRVTTQSRIEAAV